MSYIPEHTQQNIKLASNATECLTKGGVVLIPTDTVYGLAVIPGIASAVDKIYAIKSRPRHQHLPLMAANISQLKDIGAEFNETTQKLLSSNLVPGQLTIVTKVSKQKSHLWIADRSEIAFRIPDNDLLLNIMATTGILFVTSANLHKGKTPTSFEEVVPEIKSKVDYIVPSESYYAGQKTGQESTIINCTENNPFIERHGCITKNLIDEILDPTV